MAACGLQSHRADDSADFYPEGHIDPLPAGALGRPFGESVVVQGRVIEGPFKGENSSTEGRLLVQRINGIATQQRVVIRFNPVTSREWWHELDRSHADETWKAQQKKLKTMKGKTFEMRGYEQGVHQGMTEEESIIQLSVQSKGFGFHLSFQPLMMKAIPDFHFAPADFINRVAELEGRAENRNGTGWLIGPNDWALEVRQTPWPTDFEKREISAKGRVVKSATGTWQMEGADIRVSHLADQLGKEVTLDGLARSSNSHWWFEYRGEKIYVENQKNLSGWNDDLLGSIVHHPRGTRSRHTSKPRPDLAQVRSRPAGILHRAPGIVVVAGSDVEETTENSEGPDVDDRLSQELRHQTR